MNIYFFKLSYAVHYIGSKILEKNWTENIHHAVFFKFVIYPGQFGNVLRRIRGFPLTWQRTTRVFQPPSSERPFRKSGARRHLRSIQKVARTPKV